MRKQSPFLGQVRLAGPSLGQALEVTDQTLSQVLQAPAAVVEIWSPS